MTIEIFTRWEGQTADELGRQAVGYLWEAHQGEPYATHYFVAEAFLASEGVPIAAAVMRERLPLTLRLAERRARVVYGITLQASIESSLNRYRAFVELCERIEREIGKPVTIIASA